jgi:hypothetical protein
MKSKTEKRSPLKDKPLRYAGQSLDDQILDRRDDYLQRLMMIFGFFVATVIAWYDYLNPTKLSLLIIAIVGSAYLGVYGLLSAFSITKIFKEINKLRMARDGEQLVAEGLQELLREGAAVLNDIQGDKFNIDHVVISPHGIYLIETKTYSKPAKKESAISFDRKDVFVDRRVVDRQPIRQAKALSKWLQELLQKSTPEKKFSSSRLSYFRAGLLNR